MTTQNVVTQLVHMECGECGAVFGITNAKYWRCKDNGEDFYCPNGHCRIFTKSKVATLQRKLATTTRRAENYEKRLRNEEKGHEYTQRRLSATKGVVTRARRRVGKGVCPCCNRHFKNLEGHMTTKHPEYGE